MAIIFLIFSNQEYAEALQAIATLQTLEYPDMIALFLSKRKAILVDILTSSDLSSTTDLLLCFVQALEDSLQYVYEIFSKNVVAKLIVFC